jgi:predicted HD superfamily hydrolase involved in NAD metabolism
MDTESQILFYENELRKEITLSRFEHSLRVAAIAERLALAHGYPSPRKAYLAGILHDVTKQKKLDFHLEVFEAQQFDYRGLPENAFHPFSGAIFLQSHYEFHDSDILSAVRNHTLGGPDLNLLDSILYAADFLGSEYASRQPEYHQWISRTEESLEFGLVLKSKTVIQELLEKKAQIHINTILTYNQAIQKIAN